jgi:flagellar hook-associated protein 3 FlgL
MSVGGVGVRSSLMVRSLVNMRAQLGDLQRQLATGKKSDDYAGLGLERGLSVGLRAHLANIGGYGDTITNVNVRLNLAQSSLSRIADIGREIKTVTNQMTSESGRATAQIAAQSALGEVLGLLNTRAGDRYIFSGLGTDQPAVESIAHVLDGDGARAGLRQLVSERNQADLGAGGLGRLLVSNPTATSVQVEEDMVGVFGFKLDSISSNMTGAVVTPPAGAPANMSVDLGSLPSAGQNVTMVFDLPDGTTETLVLTATNSATPGAHEFTIGADPTSTRVNLQAAVNAAIGKLARTSLTAASALKASEEFFNIDASNPPQRVAGPPFNTATALVAGTPANTVSWYTGEAGSQPARSTANARVDQSITVSYGLRANEEGIRWQLQNIAALAAIPLSASDPDSEARGLAMSGRLRPALDVPAGTQTIEAIQGELAGAQISLAAAKQRHRQTESTLADLLQTIEGVSNEEVGAQILALQTSLQGSLQTTSLLYQTSILNYL